MTDYDVGYEADYDRYDAAYDAARDAYEDAVRAILDPMVREELHKRIEALCAADPEGNNEDLDEDALREQIEEELRPEAEEILANQDPPCGCRDYHCPCH